MSNVHGLFSKNKNKDDSDDDDERENRFVGGIGSQGGGSGLAVRPNLGQGGVDDDNEGRFVDAVFGRAEPGTSEEEPPRRTITMYRDGFVVDDGPYRRLDDPSNADFLRALAMGRAPAELGGADVSVGLVDKRSEEYVETFTSFSGRGNSLGSATATTTTLGGSSMAVDGMIDPTTLPAEPTAVDTSQPTTSIQVRLSNGQRRVITINTGATVADLAVHVAVASSETSGGSGSTTGSFSLVSGYPPKILLDLTQSIEEAGLKGAQVTQKLA